MKKKVTLSDIRIKSFITSLEDHKKVKIKGGTLPDTDGLDCLELLPSEAANECKKN